MADHPVFPEDIPFPGMKIKNTIATIDVADVAVTESNLAYFRIYLFLKSAGGGLRLVRIAGTHIDPYDGYVNPLPPGVTELDLITMSGMSGYAEYNIVGIELLGSIFYDSTVRIGINYLDFREKT